MHDIRAQVERRYSPPGQSSAVPPAAHDAEACLNRQARGVCAVHGTTTITSAEGAPDPALVTARTRSA